MAKRLLIAPVASDAERLALALRVCVARRPTSDELHEFGELLNANRRWYASHAADAPVAIGPFQPNGTPPAEAAAWAATARVIMNLDEFLTRE